MPVHDFPREDLFDFALYNLIPLQVLRRDVAPTPPHMWIKTLAIETYLN